MKKTFFFPVLFLIVFFGCGRNNNGLTPSPEASKTATPVPTGTVVNTSTMTFTGTNTPVDTGTATFTLTNTPVDTDTETNTATGTPVDTSTATVTLTDSPVVSATSTMTDTPVYSATETHTPEDTGTITETATHTPTATETVAASPTITPLTMEFRYLSLPTTAYADTKDSFIYSQAMDRDDNYGAYQNAIVSTARRILIKFGISGAGLIPAGSEIAGAVLQFVRYSTQCSPSPCSADGIDVMGYRLTADWTEGTGADGNGVLCTGDCVTWNRRTTVNWTTPGGDFGGAVTPQYQLASGGSSYHYYAIDPSEVQSWLDSPAANYGMMIKTIPSEPDTNVSVWYYTKNYTSAAWRPLLTVYYYAP